MRNDAKKGVDILAKGGREVRIGRRQDAVLANLGPIPTQVDSHLKRSQIGRNFIKIYVK